MRVMKRAAMLAVAAAVGLGAGAALAQSASDAIAARQQNFKALGAASKAINDEARKDAPDKAVFATNASKLATLASQLPTWFPRGSGPEAGVKTAAKPEIWSDAAGFAAAAANLKTEAAKLDELARAGDIDGVKTQARALGGACRNCHEKYRVPQQRQ